MLRKPAVYLLGAVLIFVRLSTPAISGEVESFETSGTHKSNYTSNFSLAPLIHYREWDGTAAGKAIADGLLGSGGASTKGIKMTYETVPPTAGIVTSRTIIHTSSLPPPVTKYGSAATGTSTLTAGTGFTEITDGYEFVGKSTSNFVGIISIPGKGSARYDGWTQDPHTFGYAGFVDIPDEGTINMELLLSDFNLPTSLPVGFKSFTWEAVYSAYVTDEIFFTELTNPTYPTEIDCEMVPCIKYQDEPFFDRVKEAYDPHLVYSLSFGLSENNLWVNFEQGSPKGVGDDGQPGVAGLDDDMNGFVDDFKELGWPGSDDSSFYVNFNQTKEEIEESLYDALHIGLPDDFSAFTGYLNVVGHQSVSMGYRDSLSIRASNPIPEPSNLLLLGTGLIGLAEYRRKFKKS